MDERCPRVGIPGLASSIGFGVNGRFVFSGIRHSVFPLCSFVDRIRTCGRAAGEWSCGRDDPRDSSTDRTEQRPFWLAVIVLSDRIWLLPVHSRQLPAISQKRATSRVKTDALPIRGVSIKCLRIKAFSTLGQTLSSGFFMLGRGFESHGRIAFLTPSGIPIVSDNLTTGRVLSDNSFQSSIYSYPREAPPRCSDFFLPPSLSPSAQARSSPRQTRPACCASPPSTATASSSPTPATSTPCRASGGVARRLTSHDGFEMFARFSPDGKQIAFTGQYDGNTEVYVMPAEGGDAEAPDLHRHARPRRRLRPHGAEQHRHGLEARRQEHHLPLAHARRSTTSSASSTPSPSRAACPSSCRCRAAASARYSPDGKKLAYNRVFREFRTWKRYRGGMADDIWIYDFETKKTEQLTNDPAQDIIPDVGRRQDLLPLRPRREQADQPLRLRPGDEGDASS